MLKLTSSDLNLAQYFILEKGDIKRWSEWEEKKPLFEKEFPELLIALEKLKVAQKKLIKITKNLELKNSDDTE